MSNGLYPGSLDSRIESHYFEHQGGQLRSKPLPVEWRADADRGVGAEQHSKSYGGGELSLRGGWRGWGLRCPAQPLYGMRRKLTHWGLGVIAELHPLMKAYQINKLENVSS